MSKQRPMSSPFRQVTRFSLSLPLSSLLLSVKSRVRERTRESDTDPTLAPVSCRVDTGTSPQSAEFM
ncbi:hypothetical protein LOK49_LG12G01639 [Camellia lanceoleosa]|uniref:Uncharacterized protein n=1 Tax=Camellia lanceoleosa TaxID=1840588 RepID=A0ACC0FQ10_9ERIC|nr:hypothetical protein LOK49_LG12G01639 [Camellia lanceoleosa]